MGLATVTVLYPADCPIAERIDLLATRKEAAMEHFTATGSPMNNAAEVTKLARCNRCGDDKLAWKKSTRSNDLGPGFCLKCGEPFTTTTALDAHQLETGHEMDQSDHPLRHLAT